MRPVVNFISQQEIEIIHEKALEMLENLGMKFEAAEAREYFVKAGATEENGVVKIPLPSPPSTIMRTSWPRSCSRLSWS